MGFFDIFNPPTPVNPSAGSTSPRGKTLWDDIQAAGRNVVDAMLQAGTQRAVESFRRSPAGERVRTEFIRQDIAGLMQSPAAWAVGLIFVVVLVAAFRR